MLTRRFASHGVAFAASVLFAVACIPSPSKMPAIDSPDALECVELADATCAKIARCSPDALRVAYTGIDECRAFHAKGCLEVLRAPGIATGTRASMHECTASLRTAACDSSWSSGEGACRTLAGTSPNGTRCALPEQCASLDCKATTACGVCAEPANQGESCDHAGGCRAPLECYDWSADEAVCVAIVAKGAHCDRTHICGALQCQGGVCVARELEGATCDPNPPPSTYEGVHECDADKGLTCNVKRRVCERVHYSQRGERCGLDDANGGWSECLGGLGCDESIAPHICVPLPAIGDACVPYGSVPCQLGAMCHEGTCVASDPRACY